MYKATLEGDCAAAEILLQRDHVAATIKHQKLVRKLVEIMSPSELELLDGKGYTACCYAAISGVVGIAHLMITRNPTLVSTRDRQNKTPLFKAALHGKKEMILYFLKSGIEGLSPEEWFDILLATIRREMYDVALQILGSNEQLATMRNDEGTALHLLAKQNIILKRKHKNKKRILMVMGSLAKKLWEGIQRLGQDNVVELMKNPPILHDAAEVGNLELITMITHTYPNLVWHNNTEGYSIFHIAVIYRQASLFGLINETGARKALIAATQDKDGNNILHLAAKARFVDWRYRQLPASQLHREMMWFTGVRAIVPPFCSEMRNNMGHTPRELFFKEHKSLLKKNTTWTRKTADSCMLISTLLFSVVFASAFTIPGGYNQDTGIPILYESNWFACFIVFEALAMLFSALSILHFSRTMMASEEDFFEILAGRIRNGLHWLSLSVFGAISVFMSAYFMVYVQERAALAKSVIVVVYVVLVSMVFLQTISFHHTLSRSLFPKRNRHSLFKRHADKSRCWIFSFLY